MRMAAVLCALTLLALTTNAALAVDSPFTQREYLVMATLGRDEVPGHCFIVSLPAYKEYSTGAVEAQYPRGFCNGENVTLALLRADTPADTVASELDQRLRQCSDCSDWKESDSPSIGDSSRTAHWHSRPCVMALTSQGDRRICSDRANARVVFVRGRLLVQVDASTDPGDARDPALPVALQQDAKLLSLAAQLPRDWIQPGAGIDLPPAAALPPLPDDPGLPGFLASYDGLRTLGLREADLPDFKLRLEKPGTEFYLGGHGAAYFAAWDALPSAGLADGELFVELQSSASLDGARKEFQGAVWDWVTQSYDTYASIVPIPAADIGDEATAYEYTQWKPQIDQWLNAYQIVFRRGHVRATIEGDFRYGDGSFEYVLALAKLVDARIAAADPGVAAP